MSRPTDKVNPDENNVRLSSTLGRRHSDIRGFQEIGDLELISYQGKQGFFAPLVDVNQPKESQANLEQIILAMKEQMKTLQFENHHLKAKLEETIKAKQRTPDDFSTAVSHSVDSLQARLNDMKNPVSRFAIKEFEAEFNVIVDVTEMGTIDYRFISPEEIIEAERLSKIKMSLVPLPRDTQTGTWSSPHFTPLRDVEEIQGVGAAYQKLLNQKNIYTVADLLTAGTRVRSKIELSKLLGVDKNRLSEWLSQAELLSVKAIDSHAAEVLVNIGVMNLANLSEQEEESLVATYNQEVEKMGHAVLRKIDEKVARDWIQTARAFAGYRQKKAIETDAGGVEKS